MKKIMGWMIAYTVSVLSITVQGSELPVLTLESAITRAKTYSTELSQIRRQQTINGAKLTEAAIEGSYKSYQKQYLENQYAEKQEETQEKVIAYDLAKLFDEILLNEEKLKNMENSLQKEKADLETARIKLQKGLISQSSFDQSSLAYETSENNKVQLQDTIYSQYTTLSEMIGKTTTQFVLQKEPIIYETFEIIGNLDGVISSKAEQNLSVWKAVESAKIDQEIDIAALEQANSYVSYLQLQENTVKAQETSETTKQQFENTLRSKYTELLQLQEKYKIQEKELQQLEKQLNTKEKQYALGYVSKTEYEKLKLSYEQSKTALMETIIKQNYTKQVIQNPYLL
jgi:outer membrane protein TolC